jgi:hypothetical protein
MNFARRVFPSGQCLLKLRGSWKPHEDFLPGFLALKPDKAGKNSSPNDTITNFILQN